jgi:zinc-binding alcohol dehydrogenase family protein
MKAIVQDAYGSTEVLNHTAIDKPVPKDDEVLGPGARGRPGPGRLARHDRPAVPDPLGRLRRPPAQGPRSGPERGRAGRGLRLDRRRLLRRVRLRARGPPRAQAGAPQLRAGRGRRPGDRGGQHHPAGAGPLPRRRRGDRLHPGGRHRRGPGLGPHPGHRWPPFPVDTPAGPHRPGDAGHRGQRGPRAVAGRLRPPAPGADPVTVRGPAAADAELHARQEDLQTLRELTEAGKLAPVIDRTFPLPEVPEAIRYLLEGHGTGRGVITA